MRIRSFADEKHCEEHTLIGLNLNFLDMQLNSQFDAFPFSAFVLISSLLVQQMPFERELENCRTVDAMKEYIVSSIDDLPDFADCIRFPDSRSQFIDDLRTR